MFFIQEMSSHFWNHSVYSTVGEAAVNQTAQYGQKRQINPFSPEIKKYILLTFYRENV